MCFPLAGGKNKIIFLQSCFFSSGMTFDEIGDVIANTCDVELLAACRAESIRRLQAPWASLASQALHMPQVSQISQMSKMPQTSKSVTIIETVTTVTDMHNICRFSDKNVGCAIKLFQHLLVSLGSMTDLEISACSNLKFPDLSQLFLPYLTLLNSFTFQKGS